MTAYDPSRLVAGTIGGGRDPSLVLALAGYLAAIAVSALTGSAAAAATGDPDGVAALLAGQVGFWAVLVGTVLYARRGTGRAPALDDLALRYRWIDLPVGVLLGSVTQVVLVPALYLPFRGLVEEDQLSGPARDLLDGVSGAGLIAMTVAVIVVAPIVEELFFRGLLLHAIRCRWGTAAAVAGSSVVFGATHFQPLLFPGLTLAGAVFAVAAVRSGRLGPAITVHAAFNATTVVALVLL